MTYNNKSIGPIVSFLVWLLLFGLVCIVGITNVFAATYDSTTFTAQLYDNYGPSLHSVTTEFSNMSWRGTIPGMTANTSGAAWGVSSPIPLLANHTYSMTVKIEGPYGGNVVLSTYNRIGVGTSLSAAKTSYENNTNCTLNYSNVISSNMTLQFAFTPSISSNYIVFPFATDYTGNNQSFYLYNLVIDDLGSGGVNQTDINNSLNNQTNEINNSITNSEINIKGAIKDTEDNIKDGIKEGFESCRDSYNLLNIFDNFTAGQQVINNGITYTINNDGTVIANGTATGKSGLVYYSSNANKKIQKGTYTLSGSTGGISSSYRIIFGDYKKEYSSIDGATTFTLNEDKFYYITIRIYEGTIVNNLVFKPMLVKGNTEKPYEPYGEKVCKNRIDDTNDKLDDVNKSLNDDNIDSSSAGSFFDSFSSTDHGGISGIITAPLVAIKKMLDKSCSPLSATYQGQKIELPCGYDFWSKMTAIKEFINLTLGGILCYNIIRKLYKLIENMKNPDDDRVEVMKL